MTYYIENCIWTPQRVVRFKHNVVIIRCIFQIYVYVHVYNVFTFHESLFFNVSPHLYHRICLTCRFDSNLWNPFHYITMSSHLYLNQRKLVCLVLDCIVQLFTSEPSQHGTRAAPARLWCKKGHSFPQHGANPFSNSIHKIVGDINTSKPVELTKYSNNS